MSGNGGLGARRAVLRWAWRMFRREWRQQILVLQQENDRMKQHVDHLKNDPDAIEREARERLHYTRSNEVIYTLNDKPATDSKSLGAAASK